MRGRMGFQEDCDDAVPCQLAEGHEQVSSRNELGEHADDQEMSNQCCQQATKIIVQNVSS